MTGIANWFARGLCAAGVLTSAAALSAPLPGSTVTTDQALIERVIDVGLRGADLRVRVLFGASPDWSNLAHLTSRTPIDALVELARGSTDPLVLAVLVEPCANDRFRPRPTCNAVAIAERWTVADTQNQLAWLTLASTLRHGDQPDRARAAFLRAAEASTWHEYYDEGARAIAAAFPAELPAQSRLSTLLFAMTMSAVHLVPSSALITISHFCKDPSLRAACLRIVDTINRDSGSLNSTGFGLAIAQRIGVDATVVDARTRSFQALQWASIQDYVDGGPELQSAGKLDAMLASAQSRIDHGELAWSRRALVARGQSEDDAAERFREFRAGLSKSAARGASR